MRRSLELLRPALWLPTVTMCLGLIALWWAVAAHNRDLFPTPSAVVNVLVDHPGAFIGNGGDTLAEALPGLAVSFLGALLLALAMSQSRLMTRAVLPLAVALNVTPLIAIAPALSIVFGIDNRWPRFVATAIITFFPVLVNSLVGLRMADQQASEVFRSLHASRWETLWRLRLPASVPYLFAAARVVVPLSVLGAAIAEMVAPGPGVGLGFMIQNWSSQGDLGYAWAGIFSLTVIGLLLTGIVVVAEDWVLRWRGFR
ncbi:MAG TPA: ABC transporter permease [Acidimicrobiales bacterium]|nr:ABC transporter permease [Acidimicrobiales bacterium]